jgi:hypothetical protein
MDGQMSEPNPVVEAMVHIGYVHLKDGMLEEAAAMFEAARLLDVSDDRALRGIDECRDRMKRPAR